MMPSMCMHPDYLTVDSMQQIKRVPGQARDHSLIMCIDGSDSAPRYRNTRPGSTQNMDRDQPLVPGLNNILYLYYTTIIFSECCPDFVPECLLEFLNLDIVTIVLVFPLSSLAVAHKLATRAI